MPANKAPRGFKLRVVLSYAAWHAATCLGYPFVEAGFGDNTAYYTSITFFSRAAVLGNHEAKQSDEKLK